MWDRGDVALTYHLLDPTLNSSAEARFWRSQFECFALLIGASWDA